MERKYINRRVMDFSEELVLHAPLEDAIYNLQSTLDKYKAEGWINLTLEHVCDYDSQEFQLYGDRLENDAEFKARIETENKVKAAKKKNKEKTEAEERKLYEKLKKKYETK